MVGQPGGKTSTASRPANRQVSSLSCPMPGPVFAASMGLVLLAPAAYPLARAGAGSTSWQLRSAV
jgi:hypothetical protein